MSVAKQKVLVIGCGGFGSNIAKLLMDKGLSCIFVDSANSNVAGLDGIEDIFFRAPTVAGDDGSRGSGKDRRLNAAPYKDFIRHIVPKIPEADLIIPIFSLSGGTGSSVGPMLVHALKKRGSNVIAGVLATTESLKTTENTINTLSDLAKIALSTDVGPVHVLLEEDRNSAEISASDIDGAMLHNVLHVSRIAAGSHKGLDLQDITNWMDYRHLSIDAGLTLIERYDDVAALSEVDGAITRLSLIESMDTHIPDIGAVSNADGITSDGHKDQHFVTTREGIDKFRQLLDSRRGDLIARRDSLNNQTSKLVEEESELDLF